MHLRKYWDDVQEFAPGLGTIRTRPRPLSLSRSSMQIGSSSTQVSTSLHSEDAHYLGGSLGTSDHRLHYLKGLIHRWELQVQSLAEVAVT